MVRTESTAYPALRRWWRERFTRRLAAPRFSIPRHTPWYWRIISLTLALLLGYCLAIWETDDEPLRQENAALRAKLASEDAAAKYAGTVALLHIAQAAQQQLSEQVKSLQEENNRLREETALYEKLTTPPAERGKQH